MTPYGLPFSVDPTVWDQPWQDANDPVDRYTPSPTVFAPGRPKAPRKPVVHVKPQRQSNSVSCGQTSVAMALTCLTGKKWRDRDVDRKYGFGLMNALNQESHPLGIQWKCRDFTKKSWKLIEQKLRVGRPAIVGLNGPYFSPSGHGHIVTITGLKGDQVLFLDPATGTKRSLPRRIFEEAPGHPDGKFLFYATRE